MLGLRVLLTIKVIIKVEFVDTKIKLLLFLNRVCSKLIKLIQRCYIVPERKKKNGLIRYLLVKLMVLKMMRAKQGAPKKQAHGQHSLLLN